MGYEMYLRGKSAELELARLLSRAGFFVMRAPASGRGCKHTVYPDLVAIRHGLVFIFEVKLRKHRDTIHISKDKVEQLKWVLRRTGGNAFIAVKVQNDKEWYFFTLDMLEEQGDRYAITVRMFDKALKIGDVLGSP